MTTVLGLTTVDDPCRQCGSRTVWVIRYGTEEFSRIVTVCETCGEAQVVEPARAILAKSAAMPNPWILMRFRPA